MSKEYFIKGRKDDGTGWHFYGKEWGRETAEEEAERLNEVDDGIEYGIIQVGNPHAEHEVVK